MPSASAGESVLHRLRRETGPYHEALEQNQFNQQLMAGTVTTAATQQFLAKLYGFLRPYEAALDQHHWPAEWEVATRHRAHLIAQDLPGTAELPQCPDMPPLRTRAHVLGAMYVLEGSTLGGQVITRQLAQAGIPARTYFAGYGERTGGLWKSFCALLTAEAARQDNPSEIVDSAIMTFQKLHAWIEQS